MPVKKSRKQRTYENAIRTIARKEMQSMAKEIAEEAIENYEWEKSKPTVYTANMVKRQIREDEGGGFFSQKKTSEELTVISTAKTEAVYKNLGVPYGTPLKAEHQLMADTKWSVYPKHWLPKKY